MKAHSVSLQTSQMFSKVKQEDHSNADQYSLGDLLNKKQKTCERSGNSYKFTNINFRPVPFLPPSSEIPIIDLTCSPPPSFTSPISSDPIPEEVNSRLENSALLEVPAVAKDFDYYNAWNCKLPAEADVLAKVLNYLHSKDLFHVKLVSPTWNAVASRPFLWKHLYLEGLLITNWNLLADFIEAKNVVMLNMRGMRINRDIEEMWKQFIAILPRLSNVNEVMLCKVPASILYRLATRLPHLTHFASDDIFDSVADPHKQCKLFMGKFNILTKLRSLKLSGLKGLYIPKSFFSDDFLSSEALINLKHLSLTTFVGIQPPQIESLSRFPHLTILELGSCSDWTDQHYLRLVLLTKLKQLRLEYGGTDQSIMLGAVLKHLTELQTLELILFHIPSKFVRVLSCLKKLQSLTVWPNEENGSANSYRLIKALKSTSQLKNFVWGLVAPKVVRKVSIQKEMDEEALFIPYFVEEIAARSETFAKWSETKICSNDLMDQLRVILPFATIRVAIVPNISYSVVRRANTNIIW